MTEIPYNTEDFKKYIFACAQYQIWRIREITATLLDGDFENKEDVDCLLSSLTLFLREAAFVDAEQHIAEQEEAEARARAREAEDQATPPLTKADIQELRERLWEAQADHPLPARAPAPREPFDPVAVRAHLGTKFGSVAVVQQR
jgi:uncharacterized membrane protein